MESNGETRKIRVVVPFQVIGKKERYTVKLSIPARGEDVDLFRTEWDRSKVHEYQRKTGRKDHRVVRWYEQVGPKYWNMVIDRFSGMIPPVVDEAELLEALDRYHPCARDPYSGHKLYKELFAKDRGKISDLEVWMYGRVSAGDAPSALPYATWREALAAKEGQENQLIPWVDREDLVAAWILLKRARPEVPATHNFAAREKWEQLKRCRLTHLVPDPDSAAPDTFWAGIEEVEEELGEEVEEELGEELEEGTGQ